MSTRLNPDQITEFRQETGIDEKIGQVLPHFDVTEEGEPCLFFRCGPCDELLIWSREGKVWVCPQCSYQMERTQGIEVLDAALSTIGRLRQQLDPAAKRTKERRPRWYDTFMPTRTPRPPSKS